MKRVILSIVMLGVMLAYTAAYYYGYAPPTILYGLLVLVIISFLGDLVSSLVSAIILVMFTLFILPTDDLSIHRCIIAVGIALAMGILKTRELAANKRADEMLNGNAKTMNMALEQLRDVIKNWGLYSEDTRLNILYEIEDKMGNVLAKVFGFRTLYREIREVKSEYGQRD